MPSLFDPIQLGDLVLPNRILMAPLTRLRGEAGSVPGALMAEYYAQRASAGLIITEAVPVSPQGVGYQNGAGIWSRDQVEGWKGVTRAVKHYGGRIFLQLWHAGRVSDPSLLNGALPMAPTAIAPEGEVRFLRPPRSFVVPRALDIEEIPLIVESFRNAAQNAEMAGFDGVEIMAANGYLLDQFLQDSSNLRTDAYGGSIENRARLLLETIDAIISVWGVKRIGVHLAPGSDSNSMGDSNPLATFGHVVQELRRRGVGFICTREKPGPGSLSPKLKQIFGGVVVANQGFTAESAQAALDEGWADAIAFGKAFIANPDLPRRLRENAPLNAPDPDTFFAGGARGYIDYPALQPQDARRFTTKAH